MTRASSSVKLSFAAQRRRISSRFSGRVCLITGASDRGIGGAVAERLAREGAAVSLLSRSRPRRLLDRLQAENADVMWKECDVRHQDQIDAVVEEAVGRFGKLDTVVNSAGVEMVTSVDTLEDDQWLEVIDVNLTGVMRVIRAVLPQLDQRGGGGHRQYCLGRWHGSFGRTFSVQRFESGCDGYDAFVGPGAGL